MLLSIFVTFTILLTGFYLRNNIRPLTSLLPSESPSPTQTGPKHQKYKAPKHAKSYPIVDNFPLALNAHSASELPPIPKWNQPPISHVPEKTPLLIGFTRNWRLLQQVVVSYITAGWPPSDIYVVENTGVMHSNKNGQLSLQNPFFLNHTRLNMLGVNILITPTLFTFAQALEFFSYDRLALVNTDAYQKVGGWDTLIPFYGTDCDMHERLAMEGYAMNEWSAGAIWDVASTLDDLEVLYRKKGAPDPSFVDPNVVEEELAQDNITLDFKSPNPQRQTRDLGLGNLFSNKAHGQWEDEPIAQGSWRKLVDVLNHMSWSKGANKNGRNTWQARQVGGQDDPYYRDSEGFEKGIQMTIEHGRRVFAQKWGHRDCDLRAQGLVALDAWRVKKDW
ncbi:hypothetical protein EYC80_004148 [Monilinia laxa]|uniref:Uncharacterized protein n=1 Tax=Monilinia laxa TaxID=61186 RepID=A0A5N6KM24_MONLA|nr:hypothetical protein EYC80_004148 [Monilinia laxa]